MNCLFFFSSLLFSSLFCSLFSLLFSSLFSPLLSHSLCALYPAAQSWSSDSCNSSSSSPTFVEMMQHAFMPHILSSLLGQELRFQDKEPVGLQPPNKSTFYQPPSGLRLYFSPILYLPALSQLRVPTRVTASSVTNLATASSTIDITSA